MYKTLKDLRKEESLTIIELSSLSGISVKQINSLENGKCKNPTLEVVGKLARALQCRITDVCFAIKQRDTIQKEEIKWK